jgi:hypothetical protein
MTGTVVVVVDDKRRLAVDRKMQLIVKYDLCVQIERSKYEMHADRDKSARTPYRAHKRYADVAVRGYFKYTILRRRQ